MTPAQWKQADFLFHQALEIPPENRARFLMEACEGDQAVFREVESLLFSHEQAATFIEESPANAAAQFLAERPGLQPTTGQALSREREEEKMIGRTVGHYRIETKLGEGGMGIVYAARDERLHRAVALKMIHGQVCDPQFRQRLWREARAAAAVNHPNICQIYEVGEETEALFIVMELLEGESLAQRLRCGPLAVEEAISVGLGILSG